jgi:hypothetical protein
MPNTLRKKIFTSGSDSTSSSGGATSITYTDLVTLTSTNGITPGQHYLITDKADEGIIVIGATTNTIAIEAIGNFLNADFQAAGDYSGVVGFDSNIGVWRITTVDFEYNNLVGTFQVGEVITDSTTGATGTLVTDTGTRLYLTNVIGTFNTTDSVSGGTSLATADIPNLSSVNYNFYPVIGSVCIYNNSHYINTTGENGISNPTIDNTNWDLVAKDVTNGYIRTGDSILYDFPNDTIYTRWDKQGNQIVGDVENFPWGYQSAEECYLEWISGNIRNIRGAFYSVKSYYGTFNISNWTGYIEQVRIDGNIDISDSNIKLEEVDIPWGGSVDFSNSTSSLRHSNIYVSGVLSATNMNEGNISNIRVEAVDTYTSTTLICNNLQGVLDNIKIGSGAIITMSPNSGITFQSLEIDIPVTATIDPTISISDKKCTSSGSNFEQIVDVINDYFVFDFDNQVGTGFSVSDNITNTTSGATAIILGISGSTLYLEVNTSGTWSDNDAIDNGAGTTAQINGTSNYVSVIPYSGVAGGPFTIGESITNNATNATAIVAFDNGVDTLLVTTIAHGLGAYLFADLDTFTGGSSGATATVNGDPAYLTVELVDYPHVGIFKIRCNTSKEAVYKLFDAPTYFDWYTFANTGKIIYIVGLGIGTSPRFPLYVTDQFVELNATNEDLTRFNGSSTIYLREYIYY